MVIGCTHFPERDDMAPDDPPSCLDYQRCLYYSSKMKAPVDCNSVYKKCSRDRTWRDCQKTRPGEMTFQSCWDKLQ